jgi:hypothetical protein
MILGFLLFVSLHMYVCTYLCMYVYHVGEDGMILGFLLYVCVHMCMRVYTYNISMYVGDDDP